MITTRSCRKIGRREVIEVKTLSEDEAWDLFSETLGQETTILSDPQIQKIAISMAKVCDGLPLWIITVAGGMRGETNVRVWRDALANLKESVKMEDKVCKVLKYSFDRLDPNHQRRGKSNGYTELQLYFLCCSLYPKGFKIKREELIRRFISEDLVVGERKCMKEQLDKGHSILNKLVNVCLLERTSDFYGSECVKMHDLVRAMALRITEGKTAVIAGDKSLKEIPNQGEWTKGLEKVSLMRNRIEEIPGGVSPNCPKLSTLLLQWNPLKHIADSFFQEMYGLSNLDLSNTDINQLPNSLSDLESLKTLVLRGCWALVNVPYLGKMKALKELDLSFTAIREVPQGMENLINLKWLLMRGAWGLEMLPRGFLLNFPYLQRLSLPDQIEAPADEIKRLEELEEFNGKAKLDVCELSRKRKEVDASYYAPLVEDEPFEIGEVEDCKEVVLYQYDSEKDLEFMECDGPSKRLLDDDFSNPKPAKLLKIGDNEGVECMLRDEPPQELISPFKTVEEFIGPGPSSTPPPESVFSSLRKLDIHNCKKMKKIGIPVSGLPYLEFLNVSCCSEIEEIIEIAEDEGEATFLNTCVSLPKLKELRLIHMPRLKSICKATMICSSIKIIELKKCGALKKVPLYFARDVYGQSYSPPPALREIKLLEEEREWWESLEWDHPSHRHLLQPFLKFT